MKEGVRRKGERSVLLACSYLMMGVGKSQSILYLAVTSIQMCINARNIVDEMKFKGRANESSQNSSRSQATHVPPNSKLHLLMKSTFEKKTRRRAHILTANTFIHRS